MDETFHDQINEVEEPIEVILRGCSIFSGIPQVCDKSTKFSAINAPIYKRKNISAKKRCSIM